MPHLAENQTFYREEYSPAFAKTFDEIAGWQDRASYEERNLVRLLQEHAVRRIIDVACGTGFHLALLSQHDFEIVGSDGSDAMIERARDNLRDRGISVPLHVNDWNDLSAAELGQFDAVLCLGDSFVHLLNVEAQNAALQKFFDLLTPGGVLVLDHRNYDRIVAMGSLVEHPSGYCCCGDAPPRELRIDTDGLVACRYDDGKGSVFEIKTFPLSNKEIRQQLAGVGFAPLAPTGGTSDPNPLESGDFILEIAKRPSTSVL